MDDFEKEFPNFDWRETPLEKHPKHCRCPKHEYIQERIALKDYPIILRLCPPHFKAYYESYDIEVKKLKWHQKLILKIVLKLKMVVIKELTHMESELCFWCKFGSGGRGIKVSPIQ